MKKAKFLLFGAMAGVMFVGISGCGPAATPCNILVENAKTVFEISDEFSLAEDMEIKLLFTNEQTMPLADLTTLEHDETNKKYVSATYSIDYSAFDSTKGGEYPIFITYDDRDSDPDNDLQIYYYVEVQREYNDWVRYPQISASWTYGETPTFTAGEVDFLNDTAEYSYKLSTAATYTALDKDNIVQELKALNAGEYDLQVVYPQTDTLTGLEKTLSFTIERIALPESVVPVLGSQVYTGNRIEPDVPESQYYSYAYSSLSDFTNAGTHYVVLSLNDTNYKWHDTDAISKNIEFEITPATNAWENATFDVQSVGAEKGWVKGTFDITQFVAPEPLFGKVLYQVKLQGADDSTYNNIAIEQLEFLEAGAYTLKAYVQTSNNFDSPSPITINIVVQAQQ